MTAAAIRELARRQGRGWGMVLGDVRTVLSGSVSEENLAAFTPESFLAGLGAATPGPVELTGEAIVLVGRAIIRGAGSHAGARAARAPRTPAVTLLPRRARPQSLAALEPERPITFKDLCGQLIKGRASAVLGWIQAEDLHTSALDGPPIKGRNLLTEPERMRRLEPMPNALCAVFAVMADPSRPGEAGYDAAVEKRIFFLHPHEDPALGGQDGGGLLIHAHVLAAPPGGRRPQGDDDPEGVLRTLARWPGCDARHLLTQTTVTGGRLLIYPLSELLTG